MLQRNKALLLDVASHMGIFNQLIVVYGIWSRVRFCSSSRLPSTTIADVDLSLSPDVWNLWLQCWLVTSSSSFIAVLRRTMKRHFFVTMVSKFSGKLFDKIKNKKRDSRQIYDAIHDVVDVVALKTFFLSKSGKLRSTIISFEFCLASESHDDAVLYTSK